MFSKYQTILSGCFCQFVCHIFCITIYLYIKYIITYAIYINSYICSIFRRVSDVNNFIPLRFNIVKVHCMISFTARTYEEEDVKV